MCLQALKDTLFPSKTKQKITNYNFFFQMVALLILFKLQRTVLVGVWSSMVVTDKLATHFPDV